jgi:drug/metabolite transporter (DMT)-like permease
MARQQRVDVARTIAAPTPISRTITALTPISPLRHALPLYLLAGVCLSSLDATAKFLVQDHPLLLVVWARYFGQMAVVTPFAWHRGGGRFWRTGRLKLQLARSALLLGATVAFFGALRYLPLAEASAVTYLAPIVAVLLSWPVLHERPTHARLIASGVCFAGILVIVRPGSAVLHPAVVLLVVAAVCNGLYGLYTRKLREESAHATLFYSALVGAVALTLALPFLLEATELHWRDIALLLATGVFAGLGHGLLTTAYARAPATLLAPFTYLQILWATLFGYVIFDQHPDGWSAIGMAIVIAGGVLLALWERRRVPVG